MTNARRATRDMTAAQFAKQLARLGITRGCFGGGYYDVGDGLHVYARNGGESRREQLAYLIREQTRHEEKQDRREVAP